ncbi:MAG: hypothetical protein ACE14P_10125 [Methanotrichaceae archaeon]
MLTGILLLSLTIGASSASEPPQIDDNTPVGINGSDNYSANYFNNGSVMVGASLAVADKATLYSPSGVLSTGSPTYVWSKVTTVVFYNLRVLDSNNAVVFNQWYKADELVPVASRISVTPSITLKPGIYRWLVQTWDPAGPVPSDQMAFEVCTSKTFPGKPTLVSPRGTIGTSKPIYIWNPVAGATRYHLKVVNMTNPNKAVIDEWYDATDVVTPQGAVIQPNIALLPGNYRWWIQAGNCLGPGSWSNLMAFTVSIRVPSRPSPISPRGLIATRTPTFVWTAVPGATEYDLYIENETALIFNDTFPAEAVTQGYRCYLPSPIILPFEDIDFFWMVRARNDLYTGLNSTEVWFEVVCGGAEKARMNSTEWMNSTQG